MLVEPDRGARSVGRLAPSPTGLLHLGHARTFLLAFWHARKSGGQLLMRLEDLDGPRVHPDFSSAALRDLEWLGLDWDGAPRVQSAGVARIAAAARELTRRGLAYPCVCSRSDVRNAQSAPQQGIAEPRYPGTCRGKYASLEAAQLKSGKPAGLRLLVAAGEVAVVDGLVGRVNFDVAREVGDFLIAKRDGAPAYQLAVVADDGEQGVTDVVRGSDLLPSAARQRLLQQALELAPVRYFHTSLVVDASGRRLAKRDHDSSLAELRSAGVDPRAIVAWVAESAGITCPSRVSASEVTPLFSFDALPRGDVVLDAVTLGRLQSAR